MQIKCQENQATLWIMESPRIFRKCLTELLNQFQSKEGKFVLSHDEQEVDLGKRAELILNPLEVDTNDRRFINKLYGELKELAYGESYYMQTRQMVHDIMAYFMELEQESSVSLNYEELDFVQLLKAMGIKIEEGPDEMFERLLQYLHVVAKLMNKLLIIFVNLSTYLEEWEIEALLKEAFYLKLYVILIETHDLSLEIKKNCYIIDTDYCEIY